MKLHLQLLTLFYCSEQIPVIEIGQNLVVTKFYYISSKLKTQEFSDD